MYGKRQVRLGQIRLKITIDEDNKKIKWIEKLDATKYMTKESKSE